jgi:hypothetical protein
MRASEFIQKLKQLRNERNNEQDEVKYSAQPGDQNHEVMVPPLQQELEMQKASNGKKSPIISQLLDIDLDHDDIEQEYEDDAPEEKIIIIRTR